MNRLVSIIVPIYNVEKFLEECIQSIINQTYKKIEIILVNDGSTDNSYDICLKYQKKDNRIHVINKINGGLSSARNTGLSKARGEYVVFIDSDDFIDSAMIEILVDLIEKESADIVCCNYDMYDENSQLVKKHKLYSKGIEVFDRKKSIDLLLGERHFKCYACNKIYKKTMFRGVCFPEGKLYEDIITQYRLIGKCDKLVFCDRDLYHYRIRKGSITARVFDEKNYQMLHFINVIRNENMHNPYVLWGCAVYYLYFIDDMICADKFDAEVYDEYCVLYDSVSRKIKTKELFGCWRRIQLFLCRKNIYFYRIIYKLKTKL